MMTRNIKCSKYGREYAIVEHKNKHEISCNGAGKTTKRKKNG